MFLYTDHDPFALKITFVLSSENSSSIFFDYDTQGITLIKKIGKKIIDEIKSLIFISHRLTVAIFFDDCFYL